jgi:vanillate O-demethylase ferredoxin subunit
MHEASIRVRVQSISFEAKDVWSFVLSALDGAPLPPFEPGAHIDVEIAPGLERSYSLSSTKVDGSYRITVAKDANSTGGSKHLHEQMRPGMIINISLPRNNFELAEDAPLSVFIAGGIGVTPFLPMAARLNARSRAWRMHYCVRTKDRAGLLQELMTLASEGEGTVLPNFDEEPGGAMLDLNRVIGALGPHDHVYCCGPAGMLDAFRKACKAHDFADEQVHFEYFSSTTEAATEGGYEVVLAKSGLTLKVAPGQTILHAMLAAGVDVPYSCEDGICGTCETTVLAGTPDHRDMILSERERQRGNRMMICCSGSKTATITLDR